MKGFAIQKPGANTFKKDGRMHIENYASVTKPGVGQDVVPRTGGHKGKG